MSAPVNFRTVDVDKLIYRGGQPANVAEWEFVKSLGVWQVVKLNLNSQQSDAEWLIQNPNGSLLYCPINNWQQIVTEPEISTVLAAVDSLTVPTYIHCEHGVNRTGLIVALYRVYHQGWTPLAAQQEWHAGGAIPIEQEGLEKAFQDLAFHPPATGQNEYFWDRSGA